MPPTDVIPAKAGIHFALKGASNKIKMDPRFRGDDDLLGADARTFARNTAAMGLDSQVVGTNPIFLIFHNSAQYYAVGFPWSCRGQAMSGVVVCQAELQVSPRAEPLRRIYGRSPDFAVQALATAGTRVYTTFGDSRTRQLLFSRRPEGGLRRNYVRSVLGRIGNTCILNPDRAFARRLGMTQPAP